MRKGSDCKGARCKANAREKCKKAMVLGGCVYSRVDKITRVYVCVRRSGVLQSALMQNTLFMINVLLMRIAEVRERERESRLSRWGFIRDGRRRAFSASDVPRLLVSVSRARIELSRQVSTWLAKERTLRGGKRRPIVKSHS